MAKIIELVQQENYTELKTVLEERVARKIVERIQTEKKNFIESCRKAKADGKSPLAGE